MKRDARAFLSYNRADRRQAEALAKHLETQHVNVWLDQWRVYAGDSLVESIGDAIAKCDAFILVASAAAMASKWVRQELRIALSRRVNDPAFRVIVVRLDYAPLHPFLNDHVWLPYHRSRGMRVIANGIVAAIKRTELRPGLYSARFRLERMQCFLSFDGPRGSTSSISERYDMITTAPVAGVNKHIYHTGELMDTRAVSYTPGIVAGVERLEKTTAMERLRVTLTPSLRKGQRCSFAFDHTTRGNFPAPEEFYYYSIEAPTKLVTFQLRFARECPVQNVRLFRRVGQTETLLKRFTGHYRISYSEHAPKLLTTFAFRWGWLESSRRGQLTRLFTSSADKDEAGTRKCLYSEGV